MWYELNPWVRCAFGNVFTENGKGLLKTVCIRHFPAKNILASVGFISNWDKVKFRKTFNWDTGEAE